MELSFITKDQFFSLLDSQTTLEDSFRLAKYPYVSMSQYCSDLKPHESVNDVEDYNIWLFINTISLLFGQRSEQEQKKLHECMKVPPLSWAITVANLEPDPSDRIPKFISECCKIILSQKKTLSNFESPIDIKIVGDLPFRFTNTLRTQANDWFSNFVNLKLEGMTRVYKSCGPDRALSFVLGSTAYSLYSFHPYRYSINSCRSEDEALKKILHTFADRLKYNPYYKHKN